MSTTINPEDIILANSSKTAIDLTINWSNIFSKYLLNSTEELSSDPASSINLFLHLSAQSAAKSLYEQQMRVNELHYSTAILPKSLINNLNDVELAGIYGLPSQTTIAFCLAEDDILNLAVPDRTIDADPNYRKLVLNKGLKIVFDGYPEFTVPYDIVINVKKVEVQEIDPGIGIVTKTLENIYANFDMPTYDTGVSNLYNINSPNIVSRKMRLEGKNCVAFFITCFQMVRREYSFLINDPSTADFKMQFDNSLIGFEVYKKIVNTDDYIYMSTGLTDGNNILNSDSYNYSYDYKQSKQNLNVSFNKSVTNYLNTGDEIKVIIYTTSGETGNIQFPNMLENLDQLLITLNQNLNIENQNQILSLQILAFARDSASTGGRNQLNMTQLRELIINKKYSGNNILITHNEILNKGAEYGLNCYKFRHDLIAIYYRAIYTPLVNNMILSTGLNDFEFGISNNVVYPDTDVTIDTISGIPGKDPNIKLIKPSDVFQYSGDRFHYIASPKSYETYVEDYKTAVDPETELQAQFPYFISYRNTTNPKIDVYDMSLDNIYLLEYTNYNEDATLDKMDISSIRVIRNPITSIAPDVYFGEKDPKNIYYIYFNVFTNENSLNRISYELENDIINDPTNADRYVMFRVKINEVTDSLSRYEIPFENVKVMSVNGSYLTVRAQIETDNYISDDKKINILSVKNNSSIYSDSTSSALIDSTISLSIEGIFAGTGNVPSIIYESEDIELVKYKDQLGIDFDIKTGKIVYETYTEDVIRTYESTTYKINEDYDSSITEDDNPNYWEYLTTLTSEGKVLFVDKDGKMIPEFIVDHIEGDPVILHNIGDTILDDNGNPVTDEEGNELTYTEIVYDYIHKIGDPVYVDGKLVKSDTTYIGVLKNVSWTNRLYFNDFMFKTITTMYQTLIDKIELLTANLFDGGTIFGGLAITSGHSKKYKAVNLLTNTEEELLNLALTIEYKVKFKENLSADYKRSQIVNMTSEYISNLGNDTFSVDNLFDYIKSGIDDIEYINIIKLNQYQNGQVQTILNDISITNEVLTVAQKVDDTTDISNGILNFVPDITVKVVGIDDI